MEHYPSISIPQWRSRLGCNQETGDEMTPNRTACPHCGRIRGVRWRQRDKVYLCGLCGHAWRPETPPSTPETGVAEPVQPQTGEGEAKDMRYPLKDAHG